MRDGDASQNGGGASDSCFLRDSNAYSLMAPNQKKNAAGPEAKGR